MIMNQNIIKKEEETPIVVHGGTAIGNYVSGLSVNVTSPKAGRYEYTITAPISGVTKLCSLLVSGNLSGDFIISYVADDNISETGRIIGIHGGYIIEDCGEVISISANQVVVKGTYTTGDTNFPLGSPSFLNCYSYSYI